MGELGDSFTKQWALALPITNLVAFGKYLASVYFDPTIYKAGPSTGLLWRLNT